MKKDGNIDRRALGKVPGFVVIYNTPKRFWNEHKYLYTNFFFLPFQEEVLRYFYRLDGLGQGIGGSPSRYYGT